MSGMPAYFEPIRRKAAGQWDRLEEDPELAGPWHQLFKQVQSPRHILSELLQNADDAGATEASVRIANQAFIFEHNGEDFAEEHLASLCRFGYSNKRALHTIGFRGIGFKSTFSLGDRVQLFTPSLSICFHRRRFTEPEWVASSLATGGRTRIQVDISDQHRQREVEKNLEEWIKTPISLLFFKNLRRMRIGERDIHWGSLGPGPVPESEWMALYENQDVAFLLLRSPAEEFPEEALAEIREERMLGTEEAGEFPPCKVEIVLGGNGRLYVVLPTGVETELPFACNAPFIQDPARLKIKDPETSPTNRWLLERAGRLAASAMIHWLGQTEASLVERASAYGLLPDVDREDASLEGGCGTIVEEAFSDAIAGECLLLTETGRLTPAGQSVIIPTQVLDVWAPEQSALLLDDHRRPPLSQQVAATDRTKLLRWGLIDEIDKRMLLGILQQKHLPRPETWRQLLSLWAYVAPEITGYRRHVSARDVRILPVQGKDVLYSAGEVVRLGEKKLLQSEEDWEFLASYLVVLNQNWPRFLAEQRRSAAESKKPLGTEDVETAYAILKEVGLDDTSDVNKVIEQVAAEFFSQAGIAIAGCVQLAQIAAKLGASVGDAFRYAARDRHLRAVNQNILVDDHGKLEDLLPATQQQARLLHSEYLRAYQSCSREDWLQWVASGKSGLAAFPALVETRTFSGRRPKLDEELQRRVFTGQIDPRYKDPWFSIYDWDFEPSIWSHWEKIAVGNPSVWASVTDLLFAEKPEYWSQKTSARIVEQASNGHDRTFLRRDLTPKWALRLRGLPCLPDTRGIYRKPDDLLRRTPETESLMDVEPFVHGRLDREVTRPLLDLLGVRSTPTGPDRLLDCLRALSKAQNAPAHEVEKWYRRLDQMVDACSTADFQKIREALRSERLVLTHDGEWVTASAVFLSSDDEDVPDAALIRPSVSELMLWRKIGIAERPTADLAIEWMKGLPSGKGLSQEDARRVRALLARHPVRIWEECQHWLSLAGEWARVDSLSYGLTMQSLIPWRHLHPWVKQKTADFQRLPGEALVNPPFSGLPSLSTRIEDRLVKTPRAAGQAIEKDWLRTLGAGLCRVELDGEEETIRVRGVAERLSRTRWMETSKVEIIPYIDGTPAGTPRQADVVWLDEDLYVEPLSKAKLARRVPEEIGKAFARTDIKAALDYSFERSAQDVREYLEENFSLSSAAASSTEPRDDAENAENAEGADDTDTDFLVVPARAEQHEDGPTAQHPDASEGALQLEQEASREPASDTSADESEEVQQTGAEVDPPAARPRPVPKPTMPSIIERFAQAEGFRKDGEQRFYHENGSWIGRAAGAPFPWEHRAANGELVRFYCPKDHCLEREPLQLEADIWGLIEQYPATYALILSDLEGVTRSKSPAPACGPCATRVRSPFTQQPTGSFSIVTVMHRKKLIEVALPLDAINTASAREKSIRHGHPSTLHLWWARRPLAAARAVIFAQMVDDPSTYVDVLLGDAKLRRHAESMLRARRKVWEEASATAEKATSAGISAPAPGPEPRLEEIAAEIERERLFVIIRDLVLWENTTNETVLQAARDEIWQSWRRACAENADHPRAKELFDRQKLPAFHDPFAGGGALPLEAQRLGLESHASDLNPVAVLINKAMIEIPPKFAGKPPVNPESRGDKNMFAREWKGAQGLAEDVRRYGQWMRDEAEKRIGHLYPKIEVTAEMVRERPDLKQYAGQKLTVIAWLWARTVKSPNPAFAQVDVPLASTFMLSTKAGKEAYVEPVIEDGGYRFTVKVGKPKDAEGAKNGTKLSRGANFQCLMSGTPITGDYIKAEGKAGRMGAKLMAIVAQGDHGRVYVAPTQEQEATARRAMPDWKPDIEFFQQALGFRVGNYGMTKWSELFTPRQLVALTTLSDLVREAKDRVQRDALAADLSDDGKPLRDGGIGATAYSEAVAVYLGIGVSKLADYNSSLVQWSKARDQAVHVFGRHALPMVWDYAEVSPLAGAAGDLTVSLEGIARSMESHVSIVGSGWSMNLDAQTQSVSRDKVVSTDPPYYDNIGYADLSDYFYVWLRSSLRPVFPDVFATLTVPKAEELVATPFRHGGKENAEAFFLDGMMQAMRRLAEQAHRDFPITIFYAFKQAEDDDAAGTVSTGWETFLDAVILAGFSIGGTWPMRTEKPGRMRENNSNALASSIILVCRKRAADAPTATRREFVAALKAELPTALAHLQRGNIAPVDLAQAAIGPGMAVYTRYARVLDAEGRPLTVREALALINQTLDEALAEQEGDFDADSRWALTWFEQHGFDEGEYGVAEQLSKSKNTSVGGMAEAGILESKRGKVRLLRPEELPEDWDPATDLRLTAWEIVHHLIRVLEAGGESAAAALMPQIGARAEVARELAYRLYTLCERRKRAAEALAYNGLVQSWPEIARLARDGGTPRTDQPGLFGEGEE